MNSAIFITGGAGFIGSNLLIHLVKKYPQCTFVNIDKLTYAADLRHLKAIDNAPNYIFAKGDICDISILRALFAQYEPQGIIHLAAESHVDRSIASPLDFVHTNILGTINLLECAREFWVGEYERHRFYHISTDEVYGALEIADSPFTEQSRYDPHSPYSASKAASDHFVRAYGDTYKLPILISNCSNNYGPHQHPEKLIPLAINRIVQKLPIPIYGTGANRRDWLFVSDHVEAIDLIYHYGELGQTYNIGGGYETSNLELIHLLIEITDRELHRSEGESRHLIQFVTDRAGHDFRYAIDASKIRNSLGWKPKKSFQEGLLQTVQWYIHCSK